MSETWYQLEDGSLGDPHEILHGSDGRLRHKDGRAVAYGPNGPRSRGGVDAAAERAKRKLNSVKEMKPEEPAPRGVYKTREVRQQFNDKKI